MRKNRFGHNKSFTGARPEGPSVNSHAREGVERRGATITSAEGATVVGMGVDFH
ncbi:MAG TPA: hypothetical protein VGW36_05035 [Pyrinomonadaceae bacterium]|nr:hypothetical protein [Pyrinomonadaceae bacterium]